MRVLVDTNVLLDFLQNRDPFAEYAKRLFERIDIGELEGFIAATIITNIYYIVHRISGINAAQDAIAQVLEDLYICPVDREILEQAMILNFNDFEDAVQYACGIAHSVNAIVTRDASGFIDSEILVVLPQEIDTLHNF